ncbi:MAG: molybdopterin-dependent oxidoreductase [Anaerolineales bacterium]|nr:molybdopterin-dependent oxidoreductase [Anaerolineales bacterium]
MPERTPMPEICFHVNGQPVQLWPRPGEMLATTLRDQLGLTGTKIACEEDECGACTVLVDGQAVLACNYPTPKAEGKHILTIEGLGTPEALHPLQQAFIEHGVVQCGYCIPGQIMAAAACLLSNSDPTEADIRSALKDTLCRCAGYPSLLRAVQDAAGAIHRGEPLRGPSVPQVTGGRAIGTIVPRPDAVAKVTGQTRFTDDLTLPGMLHGMALRAEIPHAILTALDVSEARAMPGVQAVLTAEDIPGARFHGLFVQDWPVLVGVGERIRTVGDPLALVAAETREQCLAALSRIRFTHEPLAVISDPVEALKETAPRLRPNGNLLKRIQVRKGEGETPPSADVHVEGRFVTPATEHAFLETECSLARLTDAGRVEVFVGSQIPYADRDQVAASLDIPLEQVRIIGMPIGGGFGGKEDIAGQIHAALLARSTGRPVKVLFDRRESMLVHPKRHATQIRVRLGAGRDGRLRYAETELYGDTGAYASLGEKVMTRATTHSAGPYVIPWVRSDCHAVYTNNPPAGAFRGFGVTQSAFAVESALDELAETLGMDPIAIRRLNALRLGETTSTGQRLTESVGLLECLDRVEAEMRRLHGPGDLFAARPDPGAPHRVRAWGIAAAFKNTGLGGGAPDKASAEVEVDLQGVAEARTSSAEIGQGLMTVLQLVVAEELGLPLDRVRVLLSDTDLTPDGGPTTASRQTFVAGNAVRLACELWKEAAAACLAEEYDVDPRQVHFHDGGVSVGERGVELAEVVRRMRSAGQPTRIEHEYVAPATEHVGSGKDIHVAYSFAVQAAEVEVDRITGETRVLRVIAATDVGRALNPLGLIGQVEGGVMMGLGNALTEDFVLEQGRVFTDRLGRYRMPSIAQAPEILPILVESPCSHGPYGAKGVGEITSIPTTPAITNAIYHACGVRVRQLPVDQDWLARELARP